LLGLFGILQAYQLLAAAGLASLIFFVMNKKLGREGALAGVAAAVVTLSLCWWLIRPGRFSAAPLVAFTGILVMAFAGLLSERGARLTNPLPALAAVFLAGLVLLLDLGVYRAGGESLFNLAHHWGAYIGPVLQVQAGLRPFYDIPLQYGAGPTALIGALCDRSGCWAGARAVFVSATLLNAMLLACMCLAVRRPRTLAWFAIATVITFAAAFLWTGYPAAGNRLLATPSSTGMRYLPVTVIAFLLVFGHRRLAAIALVPATLWSPEVAAMSIAVYGLAETACEGFRRAALKTVLIVATSLVGFALAHRAVFGVWIEPAAYLEYVLHPPGELPVFLVSDAMVLGAALLLGGFLLARPSPEPVEAQRDRSAVYLLFAAASFWFGRSHPNNVCNLAPFLALVAFRLLDRDPTTGPTLQRLVAFALAISVAALALSPWNSVPFAAPFSLDVRRLLADIPSIDPGVEAVRRSIDNPGHLGIADFGDALVRDPGETVVWTPMDPASLWSFVPGARRKLYVQRSGARLRRSGWAIVQSGQDYLIGDLRAGYDLALVRQLTAPGYVLAPKDTTYLVVCFDPRADAGGQIGPRCPRIQAPQ